MRLKIKNLPVGTTDKQFSDFITPYGTVKESKVFTDGKPIPIYSGTFGLADIECSDEKKRELFAVKKFNTNTIECYPVSEDIYSSWMMP